MQNDKQNFNNNENENKMTNAELAHEHAHDAMHCLAYGKFEAAIEDFTKAIKLNPNVADYYYNRGIAYGKLEQYEKALADINKAMELYPNDERYKESKEQILAKTGSK
jgi:tetratricopeptide (TPR) repeat protein